VLAMILAGHIYQVAFRWSIGFTGLAVLPALLLSRQRG
jgi:hypothetical protein